MSWFESIIQVYGFQIGAIILVVGAVVQFWPWLTKAVSNISIPTIGVGTKPLTERQEILLQLENLLEKFEKNNCVEAKDAILTCMQHVFHGSSSH